jgi:hypothetical protein
MIAGYSVQAVILPESSAHTSTSTPAATQNPVYSGRVYQCRTPVSSISFNADKACSMALFCTSSLAMMSFNPRAITAPFEGELSDPLF